MLEEKGRVVELKGDTAVVVLEQQKRGHCVSCCLCRKEKGNLLLETVNNGKVHVGDYVIVKIDDSRLLKGVLFIYGLPLIGFVIGVITAYQIPQLYLKMVIFISVFTVFWCYGLKKGNDVGRKAKPMIIRRDNGTEREG